MNLRTKGRARSFEAFILLEAMLAVTIFTIAVLGLGECLQQCLKAEAFKEEDRLSRQILQNRMAEIEAGFEPLGQAKEETLKAPYAGMVLRTIPEPLKAKNENDEDVAGIFDVTLNLEWKSGGQKQARSVRFYVYPRQR